MSARRKFLFSLLIAAAIFLFYPRVVFARVVINEFLPNPASGENEWVELYNAGGDSVDLTGWILTDQGNHDKTLDHLGIISPVDFVVYEYPSGDGWLNNSSGDTVFFKNGEVVVDSYSYDSDPGEGITFGRSPDGTGDWLVLDSPTRGAPNTFPTSTPTPTPPQTSTNTSTPTLTSTQPPASYPLGIVLSEFMPNPDDENEWVEIKNTSSSEAVLTDWKIDDIADGGGSPRKFSATIAAGGYYKIDLGSGFLNDSGDKVRLLYPDGSVADESSYSYTNDGFSWAKINGNWCEVETSTPGGANSSCRVTSSPTPTSTKVPTSTKTPTSTPKPTLGVSFTPTQTPISKVLKDETVSSEEILGEEATSSIEATLSSEPTEMVSPTATPSSRFKKILGGIFLFFGGLAILGAGAFIFKKQYFVKKNPKILPN